MYLDIETLPAPDALRPVIEELYKKQAERKMTFDDYYRGTSLNANFGQILCLGYAVGDNPTVVLTDNEPDLLATFWRATRDAVALVGHAIRRFDLPFLIKRSIIHGIPVNPRFDLTRGVAADAVIDTKDLWDIGAGPAISLDTFAKIFGLPTSKIGIDGSQVFDAWLDGRHQEIFEYCARDVELTRLIHHRLTKVSEIPHQTPKRNANE